jgi:hypothetical protein
MSYQTYTIQLIIGDTEGIAVDLCDVSSEKDLKDFNIFSTHTNMFNAPIIERQADGLRFSYLANQQLNNFLSCHEFLVDHHSILRKLNSLDSQLSSGQKYDGLLVVRHM